MLAGRAVDHFGRRRFFATAEAMIGGYQLAFLVDAGIAASGAMVALLIVRRDECEEAASKLEDPGRSPLTSPSAGRRAATSKASYAPDGPLLLGGVQGTVGGPPSLRILRESMAKVKDFSGGSGPE